jgi:acetoin utilization deacetylase AcuC-like enzyme
MFESAALAAGGSIAGAQILTQGKARVVFNPSGGFHHARADRCAGFCYINDVVLAAMEIVRTGRTVAVVDLDAHHGDGTQAAFYDRRDVTTISLHENGKTLFPGTGDCEETGEGEGQGRCVNIPLPAGTNDEAYYRAFREVALPIIAGTVPDVIILVLGMDALGGDPLAHLNLTHHCYASITADLMDLEIPILALGGGGHDPTNSVEGWVHAWRVMTRGRVCLPYPADGYLHTIEQTGKPRGLTDRRLLVHGGNRQGVAWEVDRVIANLRSRLAPFHGEYF